MKQSASLALVLFGALVSAAPGAAQCPTDAFEPNDTCATAAVLPEGTHTGLALEPLVDADFYRLTVPAGERLEVTVTATGSETSGFAFLYRDDGSADPCTPDNQIGTIYLDLEQGSGTIGWTVGLGGAEDFILELTAFGEDCVLYELVVDTYPDPCAASAGVGLEDNDSCAAAIPLSLGSHPGEFVWLPDPDYFLVTVDPGFVTRVEATLADPTQGVRMDAWPADNGCDPNGAVLITIALGGVASGHLYNESASPRDYVVRVESQLNQATQTGFCVFYDLELTTTFDPCGIHTGDAFEPNDDCGSAVPVGEGPLVGSIYFTNHDWYSFTVEAYGSVRAELLPGPLTYMTMSLFGGCAGQVDWLAGSYNRTFGAPLEVLEWTNDSDTARTVYLRVLMGGGVGAFCTTYDLSLDTTLGDPFCFVGPNSTGEPATIDASGSPAVGVGSLVLSAGPVPAGQFGVFFFGASHTIVQTFGNGFLCVNAPHVRLPIAPTGSGALVTEIDWSAPGAAGVIGAGETWDFQAWFRDPAAGFAGFDLSLGLSLTFQ